ncbi:MAG: cyclic nucleotide-binding domain-containing protein [bacterium]|nr:cyclic nucleotide-binding domain-containing protein [bacterium]
MARHPLQKFMVSFAPGDDVYQEGEPGATMYIVQSGAVRLFRVAEGHEHTVGVMEKGDFFGEMSVLEGLPRASTATAVEAAQLIEINGSTFDKMIKSNIEIAIRLLRKLSIRLREAQRNLLEFHAAGLRSSEAKGTIQNEPTQAPAIETGIRLELVEGEHVFPVRTNETLIGRYDPVTELRPDVDLTDADLKRSVSRRHARILRTGDAFSVVEEVGALNGTFVNGSKLVTGKPHPIADGDRLGMGMVQLLFRI